MDIRRWGLDKLMQLPDSCFGRRWPIIFSGEVLSAGIKYYISEIGLPERCVIWQLFAWVPAVGGMETLSFEVGFAYKIGDQLPTATSFALMEPLFTGVDSIISAERGFYSFSGVLSLRQPVVSSGRRICLRVQNPPGIALLFCTGLVVSSVPNEVPDCLVSV